jgi:hypothetical protein
MLFGAKNKRENEFRAKISCENLRVFLKIRRFVI